MERSNTGSATCRAGTRSAATCRAGPGSAATCRAGHRGGDLLAVSLGVSVLLWAVAYVGLSPAVNAPPLPLAGFALLCLLGAGFLIGQSADRGITGGIKLGLLLGLINFLIVASFHGRESIDEALRFGVKWIIGFTLLAIILCTLGAWIAQQSKPTADSRKLKTESRAPNWTSRLTVIVAIALFPLLISGGIVTGLDAGLAVPDWLTTFDYPMMFYPLVAMQENPGVYAEHFHRLWGMLAGLSIILLVVHLHRTDHRAWVRRLSIIVLLAVIVQGVLGAAWVLDTKMRFLAVGHGIFGQLVFATVVCMAAFTSTGWLRNDSDARTPIGIGGPIALFILLLLQLGFGATYRHLRREAMDAMHGIHALWAHIILATILIVVIIFVAGRAWGTHRDKPGLPRAGKSMFHLLGLQLLFGVAALIVAMKRGSSPEPFGWEIAITSAHQAVGALMLAVAGLLVVWSKRLAG